MSRLLAGPVPPPRPPPPAFPPRPAPFAPGAAGATGAGFSPTVNTPPLFVTIILPSGENRGCEPPPPPSGFIEPSLTLTIWSPPPPPAPPPRCGAGGTGWPG